MQGIGWVNCFCGAHFCQAPLTIDYDAVVEALSDLDTKTDSRGGTNISSAIHLARRVSVRALWEIAAGYLHRWRGISAMP